MRERDGHLRVPHPVPKITSPFWCRYEVVALKRMRFCEIQLGDLPLGAIAPLTNVEREVPSFSL